PGAQSGILNTDGPLMFAKASAGSPGIDSGGNRSAEMSGASFRRVTVPLKGERSEAGFIVPEWLYAHGRASH
ncbi:MAG: hypothetical protein VX333_11015, partial [SAR324 cluster bacterium]|nr:hypothetical protein [SAR324 cluster bacterium]